MTRIQAVISNSASCDDVALTPDGLDGNGDTRLEQEKKKEKEFKAEKKKSKKNKSCQMCNRDQLTWQMEVTGVTGRTWTCGGNGAGIKYIADVTAMWWLLSLQTEGRNWNVIRSSWMIMRILNGTFISNIQVIMLEALLCHHAHFIEIRKHTGSWNPTIVNHSQLADMVTYQLILPPPSNTAALSKPSASHRWPLVVVVGWQWIMTIVRTVIQSQLVTQGCFYKNPFSVTFKPTW